MSAGSDTSGAESNPSTGSITPSERPPDGVHRFYIYAHESGRVFHLKDGERERVERIKGKHMSPYRSIHAAGITAILPHHHLCVDDDADIFNQTQEHYKTIEDLDLAIDITLKDGKITTYTVFLDHSPKSYVAQSQELVRAFKTLLEQVEGGKAWEEHDISKG